MASHTIADSKKFVYLTEGTVSTNTITYTNDREICKIAVQKIEEDANNPVVSVQTPVPRGSGTTTAPNTWLIDLKRWKRVFTITGLLIDEDDWGDGNAQTRESKRDYLRYLAGLDSTNKRSGTITAVWGVDGVERESITGIIQKFKITDSGSTDKFSVMLTFLEGVNR